ncbi:hypothetical protein HYV81_03665 [Candidatus Woesearchaeota archaeon]|nr:hypothetical protein [Candidatus Woesearchaeota archaeon]
MEIYCENCKKNTEFTRTKDMFQKDAIMECTACKALHAVSVNKTLGETK